MEPILSRVLVPVQVLQVRVQAVEIVTSTPLSPSDCKNTIDILLCFVYGSSMLDFPNCTVYEDYIACILLWNASGIVKQKQVQVPTYLQMRSVFRIQQYSREYVLISRSKPPKEKYILVILISPLLSSVRHQQYYKLQILVFDLTWNKSRNDVQNKTDILPLVTRFSTDALYLLLALRLALWIRIYRNFIYINNRHNPSLHPHKHDDQTPPYRHHRDHGRHSRVRRPEASWGNDKTPTEGSREPKVRASKAPEGPAIQGGASGNQELGGRNETESGLQVTEQPQNRYSGYHATITSILFMNERRDGGSGVLCVTLTVGL